MKIRIGIAGYGNLGRGVESAVTQSGDMELVGVFTRRAPESVKTCTGAPVYRMEDVPGMAEKIDVMILCGGSANDLPKQTPELAQYCCVVDSFDTHAKSQSISPMWMPPPKRAASWPSSPPGGTRACSP